MGESKKQDWKMEDWDTSEVVIMDNAELEGTGQKFMARKMQNNPYK